MIISYCAINIPLSCFTCFHGCHLTNKICNTFSFIFPPFVFVCLFLEELGDLENWLVEDREPKGKSIK